MAGHWHSSSCPLLCCIKASSGSSAFTYLLLLPLLNSCDSGPLPLGQHNSILLALLTCLKLPQSYANTQRGDCFEVFFPETLPVLLSFSNLQHKTAPQKTEAKPQPQRIVGYHYSEQHCRNQCIASLHITVIWEIHLLQRNRIVHMYLMKLYSYSTKKVAFLSEVLTLVRKKRVFQAVVKSTSLSLVARG